MRSLATYTRSSLQSLRRFAAAAGKTLSQML
jgi:hypothetical protein